MPWLRSKTRNTDAILDVLANSAESLDALALADAAGIGSVAVWPALTRLERAALVAGFWEDAEAGGPRRRVYALTPDGAERAQNTAVASSPAARAARTAQGEVGLA